MDFTRYNPASNHISYEAGSTKIQVKTLDSIIEDENLNKTQKISLIKIDAELMEPEVVRGANKTIETYKPIILFEHDERSATKSGGIDPKRRQYVIDYLLSQGYSLYADPLLFKNKNPKLIRPLRRALSFFSSHYEVKKIDGLGEYYFPMIIAIPQSY